MMFLSRSGAAGWVRPRIVLAAALFAGVLATPGIAQAQTSAIATPKAKPPAVVSQTIVSSGSNSLCVNPSGITEKATWGDGAAPPSTLDLTAYSSSSTTHTCVAPAKLAALTNAVAQGAPGTDPCGYGASIPGASWVGIDTGLHCSDSANPPPGNESNNRFYIYDTEFQMPSCVVKPSITGSMLADNAAAAYLNNTLIGAQSTLNGGPGTNSSTPTAFSATAPFLLGTTNVVDFLVEDHSIAETALDFTATITYTPCTYGTLKICKVAGSGVKVLTPFTFTVSGTPPTTITVPAGPAPDGYCEVVGSYLVGSSVTISEAVPAGDGVFSIVNVPGGGTISLPNGTDTVTIGAGVTEATYTDSAIGYLEICKTAAAPFSTSFRFKVQGQTISVPAGACSPAIAVASGQVTVTEVATPGWVMTGCTTIPAGDLVSCDLATQTAVVTVVHGNIASQTILTVTNQQGGATG